MLASWMEMVGPKSCTTRSIVPESSAGFLGGAPPLVAQAAPRSAAAPAAPVPSARRRDLGADLAKDLQRRPHQRRGADADAVQLDLHLRPAISQAGVTRVHGGALGAHRRVAHRVVGGACGSGAGQLLPCSGGCCLAL